MKNVEQKRFKKRTVVLAIFSILWLAVIGLRLIQLQVVESAECRLTVLNQNRNKSDIIPKRGTIYDRNGIILAQSLPCPSVAYHSFEDEPVDVQLEKIKKIRGICGLTEKDIQSIRLRIEANSPFIYIERKIDPDKAHHILSLELEGIHFIEENKRYYPQGKLASHLIGHVDIDDSGQSGVEYKYNSVLLGDKGKRLILEDARRRDYRYEVVEPPIPGKDLILTIDETIQYIAEKELAAAVLKHEANWGVVIVSFPATGEILALASYPGFDLNYSPSSFEELERIKGIHHLFDPGSTFKIITASAALESGSVGFADVFDCSQPRRIAGKIYKDHKKFGKLTFPGVIIHSSNIGMIQVGELIGNNNLHKMIQSYGFGQKTGIDLPAEEKGLFNPLEDWTNSSLAAHSIGYEISVTAIQMLQAINTIANRGVAARPMVVKDIVLSPDKTQPLPHEYRRIISEDIAARLTQILLKVTEEGTGTTAKIHGYRIAGKTGTAQKLDHDTGSYSSSKHTASFIGFVPVEQPCFSMIVVIDEPKSQYYGSQVAAPVFKEIARQILRYFRIPPKTKTDSLGTLITAANRRSEDK
ncbi:MAG: penicillin-binding protein 2 [Candidatus Aminicenantes bacterium]|jgi:cell division protein FtsI (penicillin-binding protein 3)